MENLKIKLSPVSEFITGASEGVPEPDKLYGICLPKGIINRLIIVGAAALLSISFCQRVKADSDKSDSIATVVNHARAAKTEAERQEFISRLSSIPVATEADVNALFGAMSEEKMYPQSARTLGKLKYEDRHLAPAFIKGLDSSDKRVKLLSVEMLGRFKSQEAAPALMKIAETTKFKQIVALDGGMLVGKALLSLGDIGEEKAIPIMMGRLKDFGENGDVAGVALQKMGKKAVAPIVACAQDDSDKEKQKDCTYLIRGIKDKEAAPSLLGIANDKSNRQEVRKNAVEALGYIGEENSISALTKMFNETDNSALRTSILFAFEHSGNSAGLACAVNALKDNASENRVAAVYLLGAIGNKSVVPDLENALSDNNKEVRIRAARALKKITGNDYDWKRGGRK